MQSGKRESATRHWLGGGGAGGAGDKREKATTQPNIRRERHLVTTADSLLSFYNVVNCNTLSVYS